MSKGNGMLPEKIPDELLWNMVLRYDHGLGYSGYYDQDFFKGGPTHEERLVSAKTLMNQLYEEVLIHFNDNS